MNEEELIKFLRDNLSLDIRENRGYYGEHYVSVELKLGDTVLSSASIDMPRECSHSDRY